VIETNTNYAVPKILGALEKLGFEKKQVRYVIVTHIHLDHAGGAGELMQQLPDAQLLLHPRARKHMINPEKLIDSVKQVYGEKKYKELYGEIKAIPKERVKTLDHGDEFRLGSRTLQAFHHSGHAKHHMTLWDKKSASVFSGDNFGIGYPKMTFGTTRMLFPSTSPTQFEPEKALETYEHIIELEPARVLLTHYGPLEDVLSGYVQLRNWIQFSTAIAEQRYAEGLRETELENTLRDDIESRFNSEIKGARGTDMTREEKELLALDIDLNAQGLAFYIKKRHSDSDS
jgi:glyoxylase-like metal-dependent hydrolase (beta-lactamase superfamily II)